MAGCSAGKGHRSRPSARECTGLPGQRGTADRRASAVHRRAEKTLPRHQELGNARDGFADPARFIRRQLAHAKTVALCVVTTIKPCEGHAVGVPDDVTLRILPDQGPGWLETAA